MTLPLFLAAEAHAAAPGLAESMGETFGHFGVELKYILLQLVNFLVVLAVIYKFAVKPVTATMEERNRKIEQGLKDAQEMHAKLAAAQQESAAIVKKSQLEAARVVEEARKTAKDFLDKQTQEATVKAN